MPRKAKKPIRISSPSDTVPRPAPKPTPATSEVTPRGPVVPELSILDEFAGLVNDISNQPRPQPRYQVFDVPFIQGQCSSNGDSSHESVIYFCGEDTHLLNSPGMGFPTNKIPLPPFATFGNLPEFKAPPHPTIFNSQDWREKSKAHASCSRGDLGDSARERRASDDPDQSIIFHGKETESHLNATKPPLLTFGTVGSWAELKLPPRPTFVESQPPCAKPSVPEISNIFIDNNNKVVPICPPELDLGLPRPNSNARRSANKTVRPEPEIYLLRHKCVQTSALNVCERATQTSVTLTDDLSAGSAEELCFMPPRAATKRSIDPTTSKPEKYLTQEMVLQALHDLNDIFAMPDCPGQNILYSDENVYGLVRKQAVNNKKKKEQKAEMDAELEMTPENHSVIMRRLAKKYLPEWKLKKVLGDCLRDQIEEEITEASIIPKNIIWNVPSSSGQEVPVKNVDANGEEVNEEFFEERNNLPIALCRAEKELLQAFRQRRVIIIMNKLIDVGPTVAEDDETE